MRLVLGIESSCDETAAAIVREDGHVLAHALISQFDDHAAYGGVVPEIAARAHLQALHHVMGECVRESGVSLSDMDAIAATTGPGLIGGVMVGAMAAKSIALSLNTPFISINHLEAHALVVRAGDDVTFPYLLLLVSGGHCQIIRVDGIGQYRVIGRTRDDALGEAFDKCAKMMGLGYPGGPAIERAARNGDATSVKLPRPMTGTDHADFSFSGLKTAVRVHIEALTKTRALTDGDIANIAASFQRAAMESVEDRLKQALKLLGSNLPQTLVVAGGVAANQELRSRLMALCDAHAMRFAVAPPALCTDNGVMIAWAGMERLKAGMLDPLDTEIRARWPLEAMSV